MRCDAAGLPPWGVAHGHRFCAQYNWNWRPDKARSPRRSTRPPNAGGASNSNGTRLRKRVRPPRLRPIVEVPTAPIAPSVDAEVNHEQRGGRTPWVAFAIAIVAVAVAVVVGDGSAHPRYRSARRDRSQPQRCALRDGRGPLHRSASSAAPFITTARCSRSILPMHDAIAGIDAIADRHLTNARVMLAQDESPKPGLRWKKHGACGRITNGLAGVGFAVAGGAEAHARGGGGCKARHRKRSKTLRPTKTARGAASRPALAAVSKLQPPAPTAEVKADASSVAETT